MKSPDRDAADETTPHERARVIMWDAAGPFWQEPWYARAVKAVEQELTKQASELATLRRRVDEQYEALQMLVAVAENYLGTIVARRSAATQAAYAHALATANAALDVAPLPPGRNEG